MKERPVLRRTPRRGRKWSPLSALGLLLASSAVSAQAAPPIYPHPSAGGAFLIPQAYYDAGVPTGGVMAFQTRPGGDLLDVDAFATCAVGETAPVVRGAKLTIQIPGLARDRRISSWRTIVQTNERIVTRWLLWDAPPGTMFTLDVQVSCTVVGTRGPNDHIDRWVFKVVATPDNLCALIDLFYAPAGGFPPIPLITSDSTYRRLKQLADTLKAQISAMNTVGAKSTIAAMKKHVNAWASDGTILNTAAYPARNLLLLYVDAIAAQLP